MSCLQRDGIIALPTDTVYGLAIDGTNRKAIERLNIIKKRTAKPYTFFISKNCIKDYALVVKKKIIENFMPGPITVLLREKPTTRICLKDEKIGIRIPQIDFITKLLHLYNKPLAVTSANISGEEPLNSADEIAERFPEIALIIDGGILSGLASTVVDLTTTPPALKRKGKIPILEIEKVYGKKLLFDPSLKFNLLFVCTGNSCRSPMAVGIFKTLLDNKYVEISSAGISAIDGLPASSYAVAVVKEFGGSVVDHRTRALSKDLIDWADLVLVMEYRHYEAVLEFSPEAVIKTFLLREYKRKFKYNEVTDPVGKDISAYRDAALEMYPSLKFVAKDIVRRFGKK